jgi:hypothetical protein
LKLTDFGIAKDTDVTALTGQNSTIGTAAYMSPEQCKGDKNLSNKSDLYSLGIVFYELLTGKKPFYADTTVDMFLKHVNEDAPRIGKQVNELPPKLEALILQLMEKDKDDRPIDAAWVIRMLNEIEEDAYTRKSAGLLAATSKRQDRPRNFDGSKLDETDRDAARALRGKKKKKKKESAAPLLERTWVKAAGLLLALALQVGGAYYALRPASPERLAAAIDSAATPEAKLEAAQTYLEKYGQRPGELTDKAAAAFREGKVREREVQLTNRFDKKMVKPFENDDPDAYKAAWEATEFEKAGNLTHAEERWRTVKNRFAEDGKRPFALKDDDLAKARWGWLADKRLADINNARKELAALRRDIEETRRNDLAFTIDMASPKGLAIRCLRFEDFGDKERAAAGWKKLVEMTEKDLDKREWHLVALQQGVKSATGQQIADRAGLIGARLAEAEQTAKSIRESDPDENKKRKDVRVRCRELIDLYGDETAEPILPLVKRARDLSASVSKK